MHLQGTQRHISLLTEFTWEGFLRLCGAVELLMFIQTRKGWIGFLTVWTLISVWTCCYIMLWRWGWCLMLWLWLIWLVYNCLLFNQPVVTFRLVAGVVMAYHDERWIRIRRMGPMVSVMMMKIHDGDFCLIVRSVWTGRRGDLVWLGGWWPMLMLSWLCAVINGTRWNTIRIGRNHLAPSIR